MTGEPLDQFYPETGMPSDVKFQEYLLPVVHRIAACIPDKNLIWQLYASEPKWTGGNITFPYCRVDDNLVAISDRCSLAVQHPDRFKQEYDDAARLAFTTLVWVEIGFQGLENLAKSPASKNWTTGAGQKATDMDREKSIMTTGKQMYEECLTTFAAFRQKHNVTDDIFSQYHLEYLLDKFPT